MMSFNDVVQKNKLANEETSNIKIQKAFGFIELDNVETYLGDGPFSNDVRIAILHLSNGTHWVGYVTKNILTVMVVHLQLNYLIFLSNEMVIVNIPNTKYKV